MIRTCPSLASILLIVFMTAGPALAEGVHWSFRGPDASGVSDVGGSR